MNYTLVVNGSFNDEMPISLSAAQTEKPTFIGKLSENVDYTFRILVANTVGIVSTNDRHFRKSRVLQRTIK